MANAEEVRHTVKFNLSLEVRVVKHLHWDLLTLVQQLQLGFRNCGT